MPTGGTVAVNGSTIVVTGAARLILLTKLDRYESPTAWDTQPLHAALAAVGADYGDAARPAHRPALGDCTTAPAWT